MRLEEPLFFLTLYFSIVLDSKVSIVAVAQLVDVKVTGNCKCPWRTNFQLYEKNIEVKTLAVNWYKFWFFRDILNTCFSLTILICTGPDFPFNNIFHHKYFICFRQNKWFTYLHKLSNLNRILEFSSIKAVFLVISYKNYVQTKYVYTT